MKHILEREFLFQIVALILSFVVVHSVYIAIIRPNAEEVIAYEALMLEQGTPVDDRSAWVVLKDYEQETCFVLMFWALAIMTFKGSRIVAERKLFDKALIPVTEGSKILSEDARQLARPIEALPELSRDYLLPRVLSVALQRLGSGSNIQEISASIRDECDIESQRLDTELSMIRYIAWAIPSIGFIGTVRGIGSALADAHEAISGNIAGVTASLGVAFNSTFIALLISILIMFLSHQLTLQQERLVLSAQRYCDKNLLRHIKA
ncbi:MAG: MotA/TolQ/ExbB proton channel family protein [Porticoccaceae bacterium]|jgi:biopolymer transport protein ExbB/TolQ|nr:MotA/TolQ/ExbB proton channel family protein [Porticoccaceae bacterium]